MSAEQEDIFTGDLVELIVDSRVWGMAIGFAGSLIYVRHMGGAIGQYHEYELRKMAGAEPEAQEVAGDAGADNVIDFTKERDLRTAKTKGRA